MQGDPFFAGAEADYLLLTHEIVPALLAGGASKADIEQMMVDNPRRFFSGEGPAG